MSETRNGENVKDYFPILLLYLLANAEGICPFPPVDPLKHQVCQRDLANTSFEFGTAVRIEELARPHLS